MCIIIISTDVRTVTGSNLRNILLLTNKLQVDSLEPSMVDTIKYHQIDDREKWRIGIVRELIDLKHGGVHISEEWSEGELDMILDLACTQ